MERNEERSTKGLDAAYVIGSAYAILGGIVMASVPKGSLEEKIGIATTLAGISTAVGSYIIASIKAYNPK